MTSSKKGRQILQLILFLLKKLALPGSGEAVDLVSEVDLGESVYRVYFEAVDSVSEAAASRPYSLLAQAPRTRHSRCVAP
jgi:anaerobic glycerol-3-phosphate dehydrogenase